MRVRVSRKRLLIGAVAGIVLVAGGVTGSFLLSSHRAPSTFNLATPAPAGAQGSLVGAWTVAVGSQAGYRAREQFVNQSGPTEAVARTTKVSGSLKVAGSGAALNATSMHITADLSALISQDRYATFQVYQRDFFVRQIYLQTDQYPTAEFTATSIAIPAAFGSSPVTLTVAGSLKVHGVTRKVSSQLQAQMNGSELEVVGSINVDMRDFSVEVPDISFTKAEPAVVIEYHLLLTRA